MGSHSYEERKRCLDKWSIKCDCQACYWDREMGEPTLRKRTKLFESLKQINLSIPQIEKIVKRIEDSYSPGHPFYRPVAANAHYRLAYHLRKKAYQTNNWMPSFKKSIEEEFKALELVGIHVLEKEIGQHVVLKDTSDLPIATDRVPYESTSPSKGALMIAQILGLMGIHERAKRWLRAAIWLENSVWGAGIPGFVLRYRDFIIQTTPELALVLDTFQNEEHAKMKGRE